MVIEKITVGMKEIFQDMPYEIGHAERVLANATQIMDGEGIKAQREIITIAALLHDTGEVEALRKYGSIAAEYQEKEGPAAAKGILEAAGYSGATDRICYIIGHHHTFSKIDGIDFQILWEADFIEFLHKGTLLGDQAKLKGIIEKNFKTATGKKLAYDLFVVQ